VKRTRAAAQRAFIRNARTNKVLAHTGTILRNPFRQAIGMMFHRKPVCYVFVFPWKSRVAITNVFVFHDLDLLWLDERGVVVDVRERFGAWAVHAGPVREAKIVVEVPAGAVQASKTRVGDVLVIEGV
jgi:uncharacterized membrane protein (UPF0127 family)